MQSEDEERLKIKDSDKEDTTSQSKENAELKESIQSSNGEKQVTSEETSQKKRKLLTISLSFKNNGIFCAPATVQMILSSQGISVTQELFS